MILILIPWILIGICAVVLLIVALRKIPYLRALDVLSIPKTRAAALKNSLVAKRLERAGAKWGKAVKVVLTPVAFVGKVGVHSLKAKVMSLEERYQRLKKEAVDPSMTDPALVKRMLAEAETLGKEGRYGEAEKKLIEVLSHDPKNMGIYEELGRLYMLTKNYDQAEETLSFILKTNPNDASVLVSLGEVELKRENPKAAAIYFVKATRKRPKNPKYLDFLVEASIQAGDLELAKKTLARLSLVNPENQKIGEFQERIEAKETVGQEKEKEVKQEKILDN